MTFDIIDGSLYAIRKRGFIFAFSDEKPLGYGSIHGLSENKEMRLMDDLYGMDTAKLCVADNGFLYGVEYMWDNDKGEFMPAVWQQLEFDTNAESEMPNVETIAEEMLKAGKTITDLEDIMLELDITMQQAWHITKTMHHISKSR